MMHWAELGLMRPTYRQQIGRKDREGIGRAGIGRIGACIGRGRNGITPRGRVYHCNLADQHIAESGHMQNINHNGPPSSVQNNPKDGIGFGSSC